MTRTEHLLTILAEECAEVAQRASKALRFGLDEQQSGQELTNAERIAGEMDDLVAVWAMLRMEPGWHPRPSEVAGYQAKREKVEKYLRYSAIIGTLAEGGGA